MLRNHRPWLPLLATLAATGAAEAAQRAYVASHGVDGAACTLAAPCRSFAFAMTSVDAGGEIVALDAAGYGTVTITKSVTITANPGVFAGIAASTGNAVTIATAGVNVILRNLSINGIGGGNGVYMTQGSALSIESCVISNFSTGNGILASGEIELRIVDSLLRDNSSGAILRNGVQATISRTSFLGSTNVGLQVINEGTSAAAHISDSLFSNWNVGLSVANLTASNHAKAFVARSTFSRNFYALAASSPSGGESTITIGSSMITGSGYAYYQNDSGTAIRSSGNNTIDGNGTALGSLTYVPPQ